MTIQRFVDDYLYRSYHKMYPVVDGQKLRGSVSTTEVKACPREEWETKTVADILRPLSKEDKVAPGSDALQALTKMNRTGRARLLVVEDGHLAGLLTLKDLLAFFALKVELEEVAGGEATETEVGRFVGRRRARVRAATS